ncbi:unnamed protein product, partial [Callosobruchus maculatus]
MLRWISQHFILREKMKEHGTELHPSKLLCTCRGVQCRNDQEEGVKLTDLYIGVDGLVRWSVCDEEFEALVFDLGWSWSDIFLTHDGRCPRRILVHYQSQTHQVRRPDFFYFTLYYLCYVYFFYAFYIYFRL